MPNMKWSELSSQQLGRYGEYYAMMEFASYKCEIYSSEVDDHGVDFVAKIAGSFYEVQVKSMFKGNYIFIPKTLMDVRDNSRLVCLLRFTEHELPTVYVIPATSWQHPNEVLVSRDYGKESQKSKPEWGIQHSQKNNQLLEQYQAAHFFGKPEDEHISGFSGTELSEAHRALLSTLRKCEKMDIAKLGKSQQTLLERRIDALKVALALIEKEKNEGINEGGMA